jgi:hypothetical protein
LFKPFWCENNSEQSLPDPIQIGRPGHGGSKILRKYEAETAHSMRRQRGRAHGARFVVAGYDEEH